ncbi:DUF5698 domain-containing protein [Ruminococcaceae bacterium OttesenSCG-928-I18]|nr:DUF5698 domain-containing protein [Ruminococcaceae bacterium OttesenSCG-928-I18]
MAILGYFLIFTAKLVEVSLATVRNVLIVRGEKAKGAFIAFFEVLLWILVVSNVLQTITEDPIKVVVYCLAYALGNYCGVILENKLAIGMACIQVVVGESKTEEVSHEMREQGFGVTTMHGEGKDGPVNVLMIFLKRKCQQEAISLIKNLCPTALITVNDVRHLRNGFMK